jgi:glutamate/tyrosine decarboxylase-like PLP-dependent enzyme
MAVPEPDPAELEAALAGLAERFRSALEPPEHTGVRVDAETLRERLAEPLPQRGIALADVLPELVERVSPGLGATTGGRFLGYVTGGLLPAGAIAHAWATAVDQNTGLWALAPAATELEHVVLTWLAELLELPHRGATFTSGAAGANLVGLAVARHWVGKEQGIDVSQSGVGALAPIAVYGSSELHFTNVKALRTLGLGAECVRTVPVDERFRLGVPDLVAAIERDRAAGVRPSIVIAHAASANTGACDPLGEIADVCREHDLWLHVDGAFGAFLRLVRSHAALVDGLELADSIAVDGHKWLNLPNGIAFAFLRDPQLHHETFAGTAAYLTPAEGAGSDLHELGIEASRPWRGAATWAVLKHLGREGVAELVARCCELAAELGRYVEASPRLELTAPVASCVTCFRYRAPGSEEGPALDDLNRRIQQRLTRDGVVYATGGLLPSGFSLRPAIVSWRTTRDDVLLLADEVVRLGEELTAT